MRYHRIIDNHTAANWMIVNDLMMPEVDGVSFCELVKNKNRPRFISLLMARKEASRGPITVKEVRSLAEHWSFNLNILLVGKKIVS